MHRTAKTGAVLILRYFFDSRLLICDFRALVLVRAKLRFAVFGTARRLLSLDAPPLDNGTVWSTSMLLGKSPLAFS